MAPPLEERAALGVAARGVTCPPARTQDLLFDTNPDLSFRIHDLGIWPFSIQDLSFVVRDIPFGIQNPGNLTPPEQF